MFLLSAAALAVSMPYLPRVNRNEGPPVSADCSQFQGKIEMDPGVQSTKSLLSENVQVQIDAGGKSCGPEIATNKTCHINVNTSLIPIPSDSYAVLVAARRVESGARFCWIGFSFDTVVPGFGTFTEYGANVVSLPLSAHCNSDDRAILMKWDATQMMAASNNTITNAEYHFMDASCPDPGK